MRQNNFLLRKKFEKLVKEFESDKARSQINFVKAETNDQKLVCLTTEKAYAYVIRRIKSILEE